MPDMGEDTDQGDNRTQTRRYTVSEAAMILDISVEVLTDQVEHLREQLAEEREARRRADTIIAQLAQANAEQARTIRAIEAPDSPREAQHEGQEAPGPGPEGSSTPDSEATGEGNSGRRGLWRSFARRIFGA